MQDYTRYEHQVMQYHQEHTGAKVWHWTRIPIEEFMACGWTNSADEIRLDQLENRTTPKEFGLDGLARNEDGSYTGIQAKKRVKLYPENLGTFIIASDCLRDRNVLSGSRLYHSGALTGTLKSLIKNGVMGRRNTEFVELAYDESFLVQQKQVAEINESGYELYPVQKDALAALEEWEGGMTILHMPCGTGKTVVYGKHSQKYQYVIVISPYRIHAQQNLSRLRHFLPHHVPILVDSDVDGTRCVEEIREMLESGPCLLSATMKSADVLLESMPDDLENYLLIVDEAHKLPYEAKAVELAEKFQERCLLVSATPVTCIGGFEDVPIVYSLNLRDAIQQGYITDYCVVLPTVASKNDDELVDLKDLDEYYAPRVQFMMAAMIRFALRRCIVYLPTVAACERFLETCERVAEEYHGRPFWGRRITSETKYRENILEEFESGNDDTLKVLASVRILDEGVDVVRCDSVFFTEVPTTKASDAGLRSAIQRICRANRKDPLYPEKVAHALVWAGEDQEIPNFLGMLKEEDPEFAKHVKRIDRTYRAIGERENMEEEQRETEKIGKYLVGLKIYDRRAMIDLKVDLLIREYPTEKPKKVEKMYEISKDVSVKLNLGNFWGDVKENFLPDKKPKTKLTEVQKERIKTLPWVSPAIDKLLQTRETRTYVSVEDKLHILMTQYADKKPTTIPVKIEIRDDVVEVNMMRFVSHIMTNFTEGEKVHTRLTDEQKEQVSRLDWFQTHLKKHTSRIPVTIDQKIGLLLTDFAKEKPREVKRTYTINGIMVELNMGQFLCAIKNNFVEGKKVATKLTEQQRKLVRTLPWLDDYLEELVQKRESRVDVSVEDKLNIIMTYYANEKPKEVKKMYNVNGTMVELDMGCFLGCLKDNFAEQKQPMTVLSEEWKQRLRTLPWLEHYIDDMCKRRLTRNNISVEDKLNILMNKFALEKPKNTKASYEVNGSTVQLDMGAFVHSIKGNFMEGEKLKVRLTDTQKDMVLTLHWFMPYIQELIELRERRADVSVEDKLNIMLEEYMNEKPKKGKRYYDVKGKRVELDIGAFLICIIDNFTENQKKPAITLTEIQKQEVRKLQWLQKYIMELTQKRSAK